MKPEEFPQTYPQEVQDQVWLDWFFKEYLPLVGSDKPADIELRQKLAKELLDHKYPMPQDNNNLPSGPQQGGQS